MSTDEAVESSQRLEAAYDPASQTFLKDPAAALEQARKECPVFHHRPLDVWVVTRYEDALAVLDDFETFKSRTLAFPKVPEDLLDRLPATPFMNLLNSDPPLHTALRKTTNVAFRMRRVMASEPMIRELANQQIDTFAGDRRCDLMQQYCYPLVWRVTACYLGLPDDDFGQFQRWHDSFSGLMAITRIGGGSREELRKHYLEIADAWDYFGRVVDERRAEPRDDAISDMITAMDENAEFSRDRMIYHVIEALIAALGNTSNLIGLVVWQLDEHPEQRDQVLRDPSLVKNAVEETLRRRTPAMQVGRMATRDAEIGGTTVPAGAKLVISLASASNDEAQFPDPLTFDIHSDETKYHLAFGQGRHFCAGAGLARLAARVAVETLYERLPDLHLPDQPLELKPHPIQWWRDSMFAEWGNQ